MKPKPYNRKKRFFIELSRSQLFLSILGALFVLSWIFILGIFVGRGYVSDTITRSFTDKIQKLQEEKKALIDKYLVQEKKADIPQEDIVNPSLDFFNKPTQRDMSITQQTSPKPTPRPSEPEVKTSLPDKAGTADTETDLKVPFQEKVVKVPPLEAKSGKAPLIEPKVSKPMNEKESDSTGFIVQIGSYREEATAQSSLKRLSEKGYKAQLRIKDIPQKGGKWYRVQIGPFSNRLEAAKVVIRLDHDGFRAVVLGKND